MTNLETIFKDLFADSRISDDNMKSFCEDHIGRLAANNAGGEFTAILTAVGTAYTAYFGNMSSEETKAAIQQSLTLANDNLIAAFKKDISKTEGLISFTYGKTSPIYQEFYPHGVTEYSTATKGNVETLATRFFDACTAHAADLPDATVTLFADYKTNLPVSRMAQLVKIGEVSSSKAGTAESRTELQIQLCANIHYIGFTYPTDVTKCMTFFDQSIVRRAVNRDNDGIGQVEGVVSNAAGDPLGEVLVEVLTTGVANRHTQADGKYRTPNMPVGMHTLRFSKAGFVTREIAVDVVDEDRTTLNVTM